MEIIGNIVILISLIIIGYYQIHKIRSLEIQIKSQKGILGSAETFFKLFDLEKLKDYAEIREEKTRVEMEIEIKKIKTTYDEAIAKYKNKEEKFEFVAGELVILIRSFMYALSRFPKNVREEVINRMGEGTVKQGIKEFFEALEETEKRARIEAIRTFFAK